MIRQTNLARRDEVVIIDTSDKETPVYGDDINLMRNREAFRSFDAGKNAPLVSIMFVAYNNLEKYTKPSIEALLKYSSDVDYELILIDNGSTDGTLEYFQSLDVPKKRIFHVTKNYGVLYGILASAHASYGRLFYGKYMVSVPNDVIVTKNWLKNLVYCMESDERIGMAVPCSDNVSNLESVDLGFHNMEEMQEKAAEFNKSNPKLWAEKLRVIPSACIIRTALLDIYWTDFAFVYQFADDDMSFQYRRMGYKLMCCFDTFVHHAGSVSVKNTLEFKAALDKGRAIFKEKYFGIDTWADTVSIFPSVHTLVMHIKKSTSHLLAINVRCGTEILDIKNILHEIGIMTLPVFDAYTEDPKYWLDLKTVVEGNVFAAPLSCIREVCNPQRYDLIFMGEHLSVAKDWQKFILNAYALLAPQGTLIVHVRKYPKDQTFQQIFDRMMLLKVNDVGFYQTVEDFLNEHRLSHEWQACNISLEDKTIRHDFFAQSEDIMQALQAQGLDKRFTYEYFCAARQGRLLILHKNK